MKVCINGIHESSQKKKFVVLLFLKAPTSYRYYSMAIYIFRDLEHAHSVRLLDTSFLMNWLLDTSFTKHDPSFISIEDRLPI